MIKSKKVIKSMKSSKIINAIFSAGRVTSNASFAFQLNDTGRFGEKIDGKIQYSFSEALYLMNKGKLRLVIKKRKLSSEKFTEYAVKKDPNFLVKYRVFSDLRDKGYLVKTALKFGAEFRVYEKGIKPGEGHARWIVFPVHESLGLTWHDFASKNRVAHSTKKNLLIAIVDDEDDVTYYEVKWIKP